MIGLPKPKVVLSKKKVMKLTSLRQDWLRKHKTQHNILEMIEHN